MIYTRNDIPTIKFNRDRLSIAVDIRGLNLKDINQGTDIPIPDLKQIDSGIRQPTLTQVKAIGEMLNFPVKFFYQEGERHIQNTWMCSTRDWFDEFDEDGEVEELPVQLSLFGDDL
jgi:hypothetical protein